MPRKRKTVTSINTLSSEVLDLILDAVCNAKNQNEKEVIATLTTCRRLSRTFNSRAAPRVFKKIDLHCFGWTYREHKPGDAAAERHSKKFLLLLQANPTIATYVQDIVLTSRLGERSWLGKSKSLPQILPQLVNVQRFKIEVYNGTLLWRKIRADIAKAFQAAFQIPSMRTLEVMNISGLPLDPLLVVVAPQQIPQTTAGARHSSSRIKAAESSAQSPSTSLGSVSRSSGLDSLILCAGTLRYCDFTPATAVDGKKQPAYTIEKLKISFKTEYSYLSNFGHLAKPWEGLATRLGTSLKELEFSDRDSSHREDQWPSGDKLSSLMCIEKLTLLADISPAEYNIVFPAGFARTLKSQKPIASIRTIHLIFSLSLWIATCPMWCLTEGWDTLPGLLLSVAPELQCLVLKFQMGNFIHGGKKPTKTLEDMQKHFRDVLSGVKTAFPASTVSVIMDGKCNFVI